ncbi:MAG TPA: DUF6569 family protein [Candidatus Bathyarchaeia archaeon]|nr:DUF6569 family protein [Candidatus Bathyarchaeia archaeon]
MISRIPASLALVLAGAIAAFIGHQPIALHAGGLGGPSAHDSLHVLAPITHGNLTIFPVVGGADYDTSRFLTLDEGVHAGSVIVAEQGELRGLVRRGVPVSRHSGAEVNQLMLVNNSDRPLLLLAGEIVTGGKQDRVIGADRLVPPKSDPIDLSVFCVEPGRWVGQSAQFGSMKSQMAQPSVRSPAMAAKDQHEVWNQVAQAREAMQAKSAVVGGVAAAPPATTSYARAMAAPQVQQTIDSVAGSYDSILRELHKAGAKGVVVAINGNLVWADLFASNDLLSRYWQKLARSYAAESLTAVSAKGQADEKSAQAFLDRLSGKREVIETDPGVYRRAEISGDGYKVFTLTALMPKTDFDVHVAKMSYNEQSWREPRPMIR